MKKQKNKFEGFFRFLIYILPGVLFFSYHPLMHFGSDNAMNFEISLPLIWLVVFDSLVLVLTIKRRIFAEIFKKWPWLLLPIYLTISVIWSLNNLRGILTVGIIWLIYFAGFGFFEFKDLFKDVGFRERFWKIFFGSSLVICLWCFLQCVLDLAGVSRDYSLMCAGCVYRTFGLPHPNGFAAEPQFMGNLLLAPTIMAAWRMVRPSLYSSSRSVSGWRIAVLLLVFTATLFLTMSRGAIYAFIVAMFLMSVVVIVRTKKSQALIVWPVIILGFLVALNLQGIFAQVSKTNDNYISGVSKVINQLSLGVIDFGQRKVDEDLPSADYKKEENENAAPAEQETEVETSNFDGYVAVSTEMRLGLSGAALGIWSENLTNMFFGIGLGGTTNALSARNLAPTSKEIVNNQYISLLLETGIVGMILLAVTIVLAVRYIGKSLFRGPALTLVVAYGVSLVFFAGLPNALHIYLLPALLLAIYDNSRRKKFVS